jgi:glycogen operon protein
MLSQGVPMLLAGDELGRSQQGNNNPYCQDNGISWLHWDLVKGNEELVNFCREIIYFRRQHPVFRRRKWFQGQAIRGVPDIGWYDPDGTEHTDEEWLAGYPKTIGFFLNGDRIPSPGSQGQKIRDDSFLLLFNAYWELIEFKLPQVMADWQWQLVIDTKEPRFIREERIFNATQAVPLTGRSLVVLQHAT